VSLPHLAVLTDRHQLPHGRDLVGTLVAAAAAGIELVVLRELDLPERERTRLAQELAGHVDVVGARTVLPGSRGVHLAAAQPGIAGWHGRSCHNADEVARAVADGAAYVTISPVAVSASKPGHGPALGVEGVREAVAAAGGALVFALGGVTVANARDWRAAGAHGVAAMGEVMRAEDPGAVVADLLAAVG
jgi:thiamine-phosphate pyrophosphorylase